MKQEADTMIDRVEKVEQEIDDVAGLRHQEAVGALFGQNLLAKLEFDYTYGKKLNYFDGVPKVMRPKVIKRENSDEIDKLKKQLHYVKEQESRGYFV